MVSAFAAGERRQTNPALTERICALTHFGDLCYMLLLVVLTLTLAEMFWPVFDLLADLLLLPLAFYKDELEASVDAHAIIQHIDKKAKERALKLRTSMDVPLSASQTTMLIKSLLYQYDRQKEMMGLDSRVYLKTA